MRLSSDLTFGSSELSDGSKELPPSEQFALGKSVNNRLRGAFLLIRTQQRTNSSKGGSKPENCRDPIALDLRTYIKPALIAVGGRFLVREWASSKMGLIVRTSPI